MRCRMPIFEFDSGSDSDGDAKAAAKRYVSVYVRKIKKYADNTMVSVSLPDGTTRDVRKEILEPEKYADEPEGGDTNNSLSFFGAIKAGLSSSMGILFCVLLVAVVMGAASGMGGDASVSFGRVFGSIIMTVLMALGRLNAIPAALGFTRDALPPWVPPNFAAANTDFDWQREAEQTALKGWLILAFVRTIIIFCIWKFIKYLARVLPERMVQQQAVAVAA